MNSLPSKVKQLIPKINEKFTRKLESEATAAINAIICEELPLFIFGRLIHLNRLKSLPWGQHSHKIDSILIY